MVSTLPMLALKFKAFSFKKAIPFISIGIIAIGTGIVFGWLAVPVSFVAYVILSLTTKQNES